MPCILVGNTNKSIIAKRSITCNNVHCPFIVLLSLIFPSIDYHHLNLIHQLSLWYLFVSHIFMKREKSFKYCIKYKIHSQTKRFKDFHYTLPELRVRRDVGRVELKLSTRPCSFALSPPPHPLPYSHLPPYNPQGILIKS